MITLGQIKSKLKNKQKYWIVFTGDSLTSCEWVHPNWRDIVIYVLHEEMTKKLDGDWKTSEWGIKGFNFAYDGGTTKDIVDRLDDVLLVEPDLVIGLMGGNDPTLGVSIEESVENINTIVDTVTNTGAKIVWCNSLAAGEGDKKNKQYLPYAQAFMEMKNKENFFKVNSFELYKKYPLERFYTFISEENPVEGVKAGEVDLQHPNQLGNAYVAKMILKEVFDIQFDPEKYIQATRDVVKFPKY